MAPRGSLIVVGTGIKLVAHASAEAEQQMRRADLLLHLASDPASRRWVSALNPRHRSLHGHLTPGRVRTAAYRCMVEDVLAEVKAGKRVCFALYGHPGLCASPGHAAVREARALGFDATLLPAISAADCLFADLEIDPALGCSFHEATDFLIYRRRADPSCALVLWQVGAIGHRLTGEPPAAAAGMRLLARRLSRSFGARHDAVLYEAAQFPLCHPVLEQTTLARLPEASVSPYTTLFVPPARTAVCDARLRRTLGMDTAAEADETRAREGGGDA